jgi:hypothetical protein
MVSVVFETFPEFLVDFREDIRKWLRFYGSVSADITFPGWDVDLDIGYAGTILAPVDLLFHHYRKLMDSIQRRFVLVDVVLIRLSKTDKCYAALMLNGVAHKKSYAFRDIGVCWYAKRIPWILA